MSVAVAATPPVEELLWERYSVLLGIKRRLYVQDAFVEELERVTRQKRFRIRNDIVWNMVLDLRDKCVIDLYSWTVEMRHGIRPLAAGVKPPDMTKHGLFWQLSRHYCSSLTRTYVPHPSDDPDEIAMREESKGGSFVRLVPGCGGENPAPADIDALCESFRVKMVPLGRDRNKNRAHVHEGDLRTVKMHSVPEIDELFTYCEQLLEDMSLVSAGVSFGGGNMNRANCRKTAVDLVDHILFGHIDEVSRLRQERSRDQLYACLHDLDDTYRARGHETRADTTFFNDRQHDLAFGQDV